MAYLLTCPSCRERVSASFVRLGAVVRCPACGHVYRVAESHVMRSMAPVAKPEYVQAIHKEAEDAPAEDAPSLSGLSELMQREAGATPASSAAAPPAARVKPAGPVVAPEVTEEVLTQGQASTPETEKSRVPAEDVAAKKAERAKATKQRLVVIGGGMSVLVTVSVLLAVFWLGPMLGQPEAPPAGAVVRSPGPGGGLAPGVIGDGGPGTTPATWIFRRHAFTPIEDEAWTPHETPRPCPTHAEGPIRVDAASQRFHPEQGMTVEVALVNDSKSFVTFADVTVGVVPLNEAVMLSSRRFAVPAMMPGERRTLRMPMPGPFDMVGVEAWVERVDGVSERWDVADAFLETPGGEMGSSMRLRLIHPASRPAMAGVASILALDVDGRVLGGWWTRWVDRVEGQGRLVIEPTTPIVPSGPADHWQVRAVLLPDLTPTSGVATTPGG